MRIQTYILQLGIFIIALAPCMAVAMQKTIQDKCHICLNEFVISKPNKFTLSCDHTFHTKCICRWAVTSGDCPMCRNSSDISFTKEHIAELSPKTLKEIMTALPYDELKSADEIILRLCQNIIITHEKETLKVDLIIPDSNLKEIPLTSIRALIDTNILTKKQSDIVYNYHARDAWEPHAFHVMAWGATMTMFKVLLILFCNAFSQDISPVVSLSEKVAISTFAIALLACIPLMLWTLTDSHYRLINKEHFGVSRSNIFDVRKNIVAAIPWLWILLLKNGMA